MKSIYLHINDDNGMEQRLQAALDVARAHEAHLTCLQSTFQFTPTAFLPMGGDIVSGLNFDDIQEAEKALRSTLQKRLSDEDVSWDWQMGLGDPTSLLAEQSSLADLIVLSRARVRGEDIRDPLPIAADVVMHAHTACMIVPPGCKRIDCAAPVVVAWNASPQAGRAIRLALPILQRASEVHLLTVAEKDRDMPDISASAYLSRHGVTSELHQLEEDAGSAADIIESFALGRGASTIVMGAYGHSRMRETLLGGVTKSMLASCDLSLVMAH